MRHLMPDDLFLRRAVPSTLAPRRRAIDSTLPSSKTTAQIPGGGANARHLPALGTAFAVGGHLMCWMTVPRGRKAAAPLAGHFRRRVRAIAAATTLACREPTSEW